MKKNSTIFFFRRVLLFKLLAVSFFSIPVNSHANNSATILMYHRFGETNYPSTNIRLGQFEEHIAELINNNYKVLPVKEIITAIQNNKKLPDRTVGITIDDGYLSIYTQAWPRLKKAGFPFTIFVATDPIDRGSSNYLNWDQLRELKNNGVDIGGHTSSHNHMPASSPKHNHSEINDSTSRITAEIGISPKMFAYPFGEASKKIQHQVLQAGYKMAFGQHSGVVNQLTDFYYIPRFSINENYGNISRFRLVINALPLPVKEITPNDPMISKNNPPDFGFTVSPFLMNLKRLSCFSSNEGRVRVEHLGSRIEVRMTKQFPKGRSRINCSLPGPEKRWHWLGRLFVVP